MRYRDLKEAFTDSPAFRAWFLDSKVVDVEGNPMVVYHGTGPGWRGPTPDIHAFDTDASEYGIVSGAYFTQHRDYANRYTRDNGEERGAVYPVYLSLQNPLVRDVRDDEMQRIQSAYRQEHGEFPNGVQMKQELIRRGYDGYIDRSQNEIVAFFPQQVKSAVGNAGTFRADSQKITELWDRSDFTWAKQGHDEWVAHIQHNGKTYTLMIEDDGGTAVISMGKVNRFWYWLDRLMTGGHGLPTDSGVGQGSPADALKIFGSVIAATEDFIRKAKPRAVSFAGLTAAHTKLYSALIKKMQGTLNELGYDTGKAFGRFALVRRQVNEAPISDIHLLGSPYGDRHSSNSFDDGTGFSAIDRDLLRNKKARAKMIRAFAKTPFTFEVFFTNVTDIDGDGKDNEQVDLFAGRQCGIFDDYHGFDGKPGVITVIMLSNLSPRRGKVPGADAPKMPMTAWTLAHKIGHSFQDHMLKGQWSSPLGSLVQQLNNCIMKLHGPDAALHGFMDSRFDYPSGMADVLTMKSARDGNLTNRFEFFPEIIAQYLITGKVKIDRSKRLEADTPEKNARVHAHYDHIEKLMHDTLDLMFKYCVGKVIVEV